MDPAIIQVIGSRCWTGGLVSARRTTSVSVSLICIITLLIPLDLPVATAIGNDWEGTTSDRITLVLSAGISVVAILKVARPTEVLNTDIREGADISVITWGVGFHWWMLAAKVWIAVIVGAEFSIIAINVDPDARSIGARIVRRTGTGVIAGI